MSDILTRILATKRREVDLARGATPWLELKKLVRQAPEPVDFVGKLSLDIAKRGAAVIAEIKRASPSKGLLREPFDVAEIAISYRDGLASCLSVLTDVEYFQGDPAFLMQAKQASHLPTLCKDFLIESYQIWQARAWGADCILLIAAALLPADLRRMAKEAQDLGMCVLVEVHSEAELEVALSVPDTLVGVNNRNLHTFEVDIGTTLRLKQLIPEQRITVAESGISQPSDIAILQQAGVQAFLIGEAFMRAPNPGIALQALMGTTYST